MMRRAILIAACIGITCLVTNVFPAAAYFYDGNRLLTACQSLIRKPKHTPVDVFNRRGLHYGCGRCVIP